MVVYIESKFEIELLRSDTDDYEDEYGEGCIYHDISNAVKS